jgi:hypothetical protein
MLKKIIVAVALSACSAQIGTEKVQTSIIIDGQTLSVTTYAMHRSDCVNVIDGELLPAFYEASDRIKSTTGIDVKDCSGGTPLSLGSMLKENTLGETAMQNGVPRWIKILDTVDPDKYSYLITHELMHWATRFNGHAESGLMKSHPWPQDKLDESSLNFVCTHAECSTYQPEE